LFVDTSPSNPIEQAEKEIRRDRDDLKRLKKRYPGYDFLPAKNGSVPITPTTAHAAIQATPRQLSALEQAVLDAMASDGAEEWTSKSVVAALRAGTAYRLAQNDEAAMNAVTLALASLRELGKIERVHEGRGRDPHRYKVLKATSETQTGATLEEYSQSAEISDDDIPF
jgi:hypothetical protein